MTLEVVQACATIAGVVITVGAVLAALVISKRDRDAARGLEQRRYVISILLQIQGLIAGRTQGSNLFETEAMIRGLILALPDPIPLTALRVRYAPEDFADRRLEDHKELGSKYGGAGTDFTGRSDVLLGEQALVLQGAEAAFA